MNFSTPGHTIQVLSVRPCWLRVSSLLGGPSTLVDRSEPLTLRLLSVLGLSCHWIGGRGKLKPQNFSNLTFFLILQTTLFIQSTSL